jgi:uncharacterized protein YfaS (alpha-2-macroglobulin family)
MGPFTLEPGKTGTHRIRLPQYTGSVRVMVTAAGEANSFGSAEKSVIVSDPLMVLATAPRVLSPGDRVALPVTLFAQKKDIDEVKVTVTGNEMVAFAEPSATVRFTEPGEKDLQFLFTTASRTGKAVFSVTATAGGETALYDMEVEVRTPNPPERRSETRTVAPGGRYEKSFAPFGIAGTSSATAEIFSLPSINLTRRLAWLTNYPHSCTEQITSAAFPQVYLPGLMGSNLPDPAGVRNNVQEALRKNASRQLPSGALTLWPGGAHPDDWVTSYAGHFAIEAQKAGYALPEGFMSRWTAYQRNAAASWRYQPQYRFTATDQAYRLFTLALAGTPEKGAMNRMRENAELPSLAKWFLAAAYATTGRPEVAQGLIDVRNMKTEPDYNSYYYGSSLRDRSIILYTLTTIGNTGEALELLKEIAAGLSREQWYSTQTTAWALFSYMNFSRQVRGESDQPMKVSVDFNGKTEKISSSEGAIMRTLTPETTNKLVIENESDRPLFVTFTEQGVPLTTDQTVSESNLTMNVDYVDMAQAPVDVTSLAQGTGFMMVVTLTNTSFRQIGNLALTQMVPSGWEIQNTRLFEANLLLKESVYDYRDFRDDRVNTYFSLKGGETKKFYIILTASYRGVYSLPSVVCEAMYDEGVYARRPGREVTVRE